MLDWLDKRFPEKVVVTKSRYNELLDKIELIENSINYTQGLISTEVSKLKIEANEMKQRAERFEKAISGIKEALVKGEFPMPKTEEQRDRENFIKDGILPGGINARQIIKSAS